MEALSFGIGLDLVLLEELSNARGIPGREEEVRGVLARALKGRVDRLECDSMGNLIARKGGPSGRRMMIAAHMDEVGMMVTRVEKTGFLRFGKAGGLDDRMLTSKAVLVGKDGIRGVIGHKPIHLLDEAETRKPPGADDLLIDIGSRSKDEAEQLVSPGDMVTFDTRFERLTDQTIKGKALDDRAGCALLAAVLSQPWKGLDVLGAFTVQEEIGLRGARAAAYALRPDAALVIEATLCHDAPGTEPCERCTRLGAGPVITFMDQGLIADPVMVRELRDTAEREGIPYQFKESTGGGTDASSIHLAREGIRTAVLSVPCRYIHSSCSIMCLEDAENCLRLASAYLRRVESGECLKSEGV